MGSLETGNPNAIWMNFRARYSRIRQYRPGIKQSRLVQAFREECLLIYPLHAVLTVEDSYSLCKAWSYKLASSLSKISWGDIPCTIIIFCLVDSPLTTESCPERVPNKPRMNCSNSSLALSWLMACRICTRTKSLEILTSEAFCALSSTCTANLLSLHIQSAAKAHDEGDSQNGGICRLLSWHTLKLFLFLHNSQWKYVHAGKVTKPIRINLFSVKAVHVIRQLCCSF